MIGTTCGEPMIGTTLGNYVIDEKLGAGGMGVVYKATDKQLGRRVAIKTLTLGPTMQREFLARFLREARAESQLQHPCVVILHQLSMESDPPYIVMEYVEGRTLKDIISGKALPVKQLCEIAIQVADGLAAAHTSTPVAVLTAPGGGSTGQLCVCFGTIGADASFPVAKSICQQSAVGWSTLLPPPAKTHSNE